jgi:outer membrane protein assembly factor BamA
MLNKINKCTIIYYFPKGINSFVFLFILLLINNSGYSQDKHSHQTDSSEDAQINFSKLDSLRPLVLDVVIEGNKTTQDEVILREMQLRKGMFFSSELYKEDKEKIYNLGLFNKVDITPILWPSNEVVLNVKVHEKWYIYPMPTAGLVDGELRKIWVGMNLRWSNFRGRNERVGLNFGVGSNSFVKANYNVPWIGDDMHIFTNISGGFSNDQNRSLLALGRINGQPFYYYRLNNFTYRNYNFNITTGKYFTKNFNIYTDIGFSIMSVSELGAGRTQSPDGTDKYMILGAGLNYDSRNSREYTTKGYFINVNYKHYGFLKETDNFGRFNVDVHSFTPINLKKDYAVTIATRLFSSIAEGSSIPYYNHMIMGYGADYVRGWYRFGFEGDNEFTLDNEIRIPIIQPDYLKNNNLPVIKKIKYLKDYTYRYGLYFKLFYDIGTIWNQYDDYRRIRVLNGTGLGFDALLPFGVTARAEYGLRLGEPTVGQVILGLGVKF